MTIAAAELLFGVRYTDAERAQMRDSLAEQIQQAIRRRAANFPMHCRRSTVTATA